MADATNPTDPTPPADGSAPDEGDQTQTPAGSTPEEQIASARRRQAGAEAARQEAARQLAIAQAENQRLLALTQTAAGKEQDALTASEARAAAAEKRADEAESKANNRILDARFPTARKDYPEVTDEVKLARLEAMLSDGVPAAGDPPKPLGNNPSRGANPAVDAKPETPEDILARLATMQDPNRPGLIVS